MMANPDQALLDDLLAEVEAAWIGRRDASVVDRLAAKHPQHAEELYEFFAELFFGERGDNVPASLGGSLDRWFEERGRQIASEAVEEARNGEILPELRLAAAVPSSSPITAPDRIEGARASERPFLTLVEENTELEADEIATQLDDVSVDFLLFTERYPELYPLPVREELARRASKRFGIPLEVALLSFDYRPEIRMAASRAKRFTGRPTSFQELLRRSGLLLEQERYWATIAHRG